jgi:nicotinamidase/pyrazinamidase
MITEAHDVLIVVDVQNDFCPGGALAVPGGDQVVSLINRLSRRFPNVVLTQDWHPRGHTSFASSHPGKAPFETTTLPYGPQVLWPDHCIQGSSGAAFRADLEVRHAQAIIRKGYRASVDSYSGFLEADRRTPTGLEGYLRERDLSRVFVVGLALDFCVAWTAQDAAACGFDTTVIEDACRAIDTSGSLAAARTGLATAGVRVISSSALEAVQ